MMTPVKFFILGTVSFTVLIGAQQSYAQDATNAATTSAIVTVQENTAAEEFRDGMSRAGEGIANAAKDFTDAAAKEIHKMDADVVKSGPQSTTSGDNTYMSATGMLNKPVYNAAGKKIATVKDIILDENGQAQMVIISDGGILGVGDKLTAFDYGLITKLDANGDVIMPVSEDMIAKAAAFSYDNSEASDSVHVIPAGGYSALALLKGNLVDFRGEKVANIENIEFLNGGKARVIFAYDQTMGVGGRTAAFDFGDLTLVRKEGSEVDFRMNSDQSAKFEEFINLAKS
ncbi:MAG: PRC-barrel domain-containing protein [Alphaproteobacteria bacterium]|nr:PRC-barrel domain-containing protein [Alphaproteobacteria bacterium]